MGKGNKSKQAHNTTGPPPRAATWWATLHMRHHGVLQTTTDDDDRRQRASLVWPSYIICRRASNKDSEPENQEAGT